MDKRKLKEKRTRELLRVGKFVIGLIAIPIILQAIYTDLKVHGYDEVWIALRLGIIPVGLLSLFTYRISFFTRHPVVPIMGVALYVTAIHLFFVSQTGYAESKYFHSYIQLLMGFTILPFTWGMYLFGTGVIVGSYSYLILHNSAFDWSVFSQSNVIFLKTYVVIAFATFYLMNRVRQKVYLKEIELEREIETRQSIIEAKARELSEANIALIRQESENARYKMLGNLAIQVAHNVRSPVGTIDVIVNSTPELPMAAKMPLLNAIAQIRGVANKLLKTKPHELEKGFGDHPIVSIPRLLTNVIEEKTLLLSRYRGLEIRSNLNLHSSDSFCAKVDPTEFTAAISNLIHNSFEALDENGVIDICLNENGEDLFVTVKDRGRGMPEDILNSVKKGQVGLSYMKPGGSGLGIPHAKASVESWGGKFEIFSQENFGTTVKLTIPRVTA